MAQQQALTCSLPDEIEGRIAADVFRSQRDDLTLQLKHSLTEIASKLYAKAVITPASLERVVNQAQIPSVKTIVLLNAVEDRIKVEPWVFTEFVEILDSEPSLRSLASELVRSYLKEMPNAVPNPSPGTPQFPSQPTGPGTPQTSHPVTPGTPQLPGMPLAVAPEAILCSQPAFHPLAVAPMTPQAASNMQASQPGNDSSLQLADFLQQQAPLITQTLTASKTQTSQLANDSPSLENSLLAGIIHALAGDNIGLAADEIRSLSSVSDVQRLANIFEPNAQETDPVPASQSVRSQPSSQPPVTSQSTSDVPPWLASEPALRQAPVTMQLSANDNPQPTQVTKQSLNDNPRPAPVTQQSLNDNPRPAPVTQRSLNDNPRPAPVTQRSLNDNPRPAPVTQQSVTGAPVISQPANGHGIQIAPVSLQPTSNQTAASNQPVPGSTQVPIQLAAATYTQEPDPYAVKLANIDDSTVLDTQHTNAVSKYIKTLTPDKSRELGAELGLAYNNLLRMSAGTLHLDMAHAWLVGHDQSRDVSGDPTWRALALVCAKQDMWGLVWRIEQEHFKRPNPGSPEFNLANVTQVLQGLPPSKLPDLAQELGVKESNVNLELWIGRGSKPKASWAVLKAALLNVEASLAERIP